MSVRSSVVILEQLLAIVCIERESVSVRLQLGDSSGRVGGIYGK